MMTESPSSCQTPPAIPRPAIPASTPSPSPLPKNDCKVDKSNKTVREEPLPLTTSEGQRPAKGNPPLDKETQEKLVKDVSAAKDAVKFLKPGFPKETTGRKGTGEAPTGRGRAKGRGKGGRGRGKGSKKKEEAEELPETHTGFGDEDDDEIVDLLEELDEESDASVDAPTERLSQPRTPPQPKAAAKAKTKAATAPKTKRAPKAAPKKKESSKAAPKKKESLKAKAKAKSKALTKCKSTQKRAASSDEAGFINYHHCKKEHVFSKGLSKVSSTWSCLVVAHQGRVPTGDHSLRHAYHKHLKDSMASLKKDGITGRAALKEARSTSLIEKHICVMGDPPKRIDFSMSLRGQDF